MYAANEKIKMFPNSHAKYKKVNHLSQMSLFQFKIKRNEYTYLVPIPYEKKFYRMHDHQLIHPLTRHHH